jgi:hypothetical protein
MSELFCNLHHICWNKTDVIVCVDLDQKQKFSTNFSEDLYQTSLEPIHPNWSY